MSLAVGRCAPDVEIAKLSEGAGAPLCYGAVWCEMNDLGLEHSGSVSSFSKGVRWGFLMMRKLYSG